MHINSKQDDGHNRLLGHECIEPVIHTGETIFGDLSLNGPELCPTKVSE